MSIITFFVYLENLIMKQKHLFIIFRVLVYPHKCPHPKAYYSVITWKTVESKVNRETNKFGAVSKPNAGHLCISTAGNVTYVYKHTHVCTHTNTQTGKIGQDFTFCPHIDQYLAEFTLFPLSSVYMCVRMCACMYLCMKSDPD